MNEVEAIVGNRTEFLNVLKAKFQLFHLSNIFFRDLQYGVMAYLQEHGTKMRNIDAERVARAVAEAFERQGIFKQVDHQSWVLVYPEFALPRVEKKAVAS
jgi:hypothetical protein